MVTTRRRPRRSPAAERRRTQAVGAAGVGVAAVLPVYLWHDVVADIAQVSRVDAVLVAGWVPWVLMTLGLLCVVPIAVEHVRSREARFHRPGTGAWAGWGVSLYLLGFGLATQVAQLHGVNG